MESKAKSILSPKHILLITLSLLLVLGGGATHVAQARSLYVIGSITHWGPLPIFTYDIGPDGRLTFQTEQGIPYEGGGAVGIAVDWQSEFLFVTYEFLDSIHVLDARTMAYIGRASAPGSEDLAGIAYDELKGRLYCVDRDSDRLYVYEWNPSTGKLTAEPGSPFRLEGSAAYGIALDEENGLLYTANFSPYIPVYNTTGWSRVDTIKVARPAISVAVDPIRGMLYTGAGYVGETGLCQHNLVTGEDKIVQVDPVGGVMGLTVDWATGFVYTTTGRSNREGGDDLLVYDPSLTLVQSIPDIGNPTGIVIPARELGYNPLRFTKKVVTDWENRDADKIYIGAGETVTYELCFANTDIAREVTIVDVLPEQVTFVSADGDGTAGHYDAASHTYSWSLGTISAGSNTCLNLSVKVPEGIPADTQLRNHATIKTSALPPATVSADVRIRGKAITPLGLTKQIISGVQKEEGQALANAGDLVSYAISFSNEGNNYPVTRVSVVDTLPETMAFVSTEGGPDGGSYDPVTHTYTGTYASLAPGATGRITLTGQVGKDTPIGTTVANSVIIDCNETEPTSASADFVVAGTELLPLNLTKQITAGGTDPNNDGTRYVNVGEDITYLICCDNRTNDRQVDGISLVDYLPMQMTFVRASEDGQSGHYDPDSHAYMWTIPALAADEGVCLELTARVKDDTPVGTVLRNRATVDSDQTEATTAGASVTVHPIAYRPLNLTKRITDGGVPDDEGIIRSVGIGEDITYEICFDSNDNDYRIQGLLLVDVLPPEVTFVTAEGDGVYGHYDADKHAYNWSYASLIPGFETRLYLVAQLRDDTAVGTTITNTVTIDSDDTEPQTTTVSAVAEVAKLKPLRLTKTVTAGIAGQNDRGTIFVSLGEEITYTICMANDNHQVLDEVVVIDKLPEAVTFVTADGDGEFGRYDRDTHAYTWRFSTVEADGQICVDLTVRVNEDAGHGVAITNLVRTEFGGTTSAVEIEVKAESEPPLLRKTVVTTKEGQKVEGGVISASPGEELTYEICLENNQGIALHEVVITDALPAGVTVVSADGESGYYDPGSHAYIWNYPKVESGAAICLKLTVRLGYHLQPDDILRNTATSDASETPAASADVDVVVGDAAMEIPLTVSPLILGREGYNRSDEITVLLEMPEDMRATEVLPNQLRLDPGGIKASAETIFLEDGQLKIRATFALADVLAAVPEDGLTTLYVGGQLQSGLSFFGEGTVLVVAVRPF
ncbi:MAG: DUF11 domain-containing protein [Phycisphaerales bacterium]|nr:MAG: DUF11 domain-containing protein [Phycisphaerales bacterium]